MTTIRIEERETRSDGSFVARVVFDEGRPFDVSIVDPADPSAESELAWYFEEHLRFPFLDKDRELAAVQKIGAYGENLFEQVFRGAASHDYLKLRDRAFDDCRLEVAGSAAFHRLHWETLRDPDLGKPLALRFPIIRRAGLPKAQFDMPPERPSLNILVVSARPDGPKDVGYRTISRPLLDAMRTAKMPVRVDLVRPGTWNALETNLRRATEEHGSGWYQVIHFDLHGAFSDFDVLEQEREAGSVMFNPLRLPRFEGRRAFLFFETAQEGQAEAVPAAAVAGLLAEHRVPVAVLNACQSAMQTATEAGLAQHLVEAGVPVAVGMAYSVTVTAAARAMPILYERLGDGADPVVAMHAARLELFDHRARRAYFDQLLDLEDWMLPVLFRQQQVQLQVRGMTDAEQAQYRIWQASQPEEPDTEYGFVGRDLDVQAVERRLLIDRPRNQLLIRAMAGAGKSTFLEHLGWWWQRTGLVERVLRFSYEERAWTTSQIVREISSQLLGSVGQARLEQLPENAQLEEMAQLLNSRRHMLILDNAESITASSDAIPHALSEVERERLKRFLSKLRGGRTLVLIGSREPETWLARHSFGDNIYPLLGLDPQAVSTLVERILARHDATRRFNQDGERDEFQELISLLGGYPLPLTVVLPELSARPPSEVLAELRAGDKTADPSGLIKKAIEYSHGKLDPAAQTSLLLLAPFTAVIPTGPALTLYRDLLHEHQAIQAIGDVDLEAAVQRAVDIGLASPHPQFKNLVQVQPVLPYFLRTRLQDQPDVSAAAAQAHYQLYKEIGKELHQLLLAPTSDYRGIGQVGARAQYANLTSALRYGLETKQSIKILVIALDEYLDQARQLTVRRQLLESTIADYAKPDGDEEQQSELARLHNLAGAVALDEYKLDDAETHYQAAIAILEKLDDPPRVAGNYRQLGRIAYMKHLSGKAEAYFKLALDVFLERGDRKNSADCYDELGLVAHQEMRLDEAERCFHKALELYRELEYPQLVGVVYGQSAMVSMDRHEFTQAERNYREALKIFLDFNDGERIATTYRELGAVAEVQNQLSEAEQYFRLALKTSLEIDDRYQVAQSYGKLGGLMAKQRRHTEAERYFRQALEIYEEFNDRHRMATVSYHLGVVARDQRQFREAERYYRQALDSFEEFDDQGGAAKTFHELGLVAEEQRQLDAAAALYRQALELIRDIGNMPLAFDWAFQLGRLLDQLQRHTEAAETFISAALAWYHFASDWQLDVAGWLKREREIIGPYALTKLMQTNMPSESIAGLNNAIENGNEPLISDFSAQVGPSKEL